MDKSTSFEITGNITEFCAPKTNGQHTNHEFCISVPGDYPQEIRFAAGKKLVDDLLNFRLGDKVTVKFNLNGRRAKSDIVWNTLRAWAMNLEEEQAPRRGVNSPRKPLHEQRNQRSSPPVPGGYMDGSNNGDEDDIPF